jgi:hypothetical protein
MPPPPPPLDASDGPADASSGPVLVIDPAARNDSATIDLTAAGASDWTERHVGTDLGNRCAPCAHLLDTLRSSAATVFAYSIDTRQFLWSNGAPTASGSMTGGLYTEGVGSAFSTGAATTPARQLLTLHVDTFNAGASITANIDGSGIAPATLTIPAKSGTAPYAIRIHFAAPNGLRLAVTFAETVAVPVDGDIGNIAVSAVTLAPDP